MSAKDVTPDLDFLKVGHLWYTLTVLQNEKSAEDQDQISGISNEICGLMDRYGVKHPRAAEIISLLSYLDKESKYNESWLCDGDKFVSRENIIAEHANTIFTNPSQIEALETMIPKLFTTEMYEDLFGLLSKFQNMVQFTSQPRSIEELESNNHNRFFFYLYCIYSRRSLVFVTRTSHGDDTGVSDRGNDTWPMPFVNIPEDAPLDEKNGGANIYLKVTRYYKKNEKLFEPAENRVSYELVFYWLIRIMNLTHLFSKLLFREFLEDFNELMNIDVPSNYAMYKPSQLMMNGNLIPQNTLTVMYEFCTLICKPTKSLSLNDNEDDSRMADELILNTSDFPNYVYNSVLLPLSKLQYKAFKENYERNSFLKTLNAEIGYYLALSQIDIKFFYHYVQMMTLSKGFLLFMSMSKRITKEKLMMYLGRDENDDAVFNSFISLMGILGLGNLGVCYDNHGCSFYRENINNVETNLLEEFDAVSRKLEGESIATLFKEILVEKYISD